MTKIKITEIKESYTVKSRIRGAETTADGSHFEEKTLVRFKEVITVEGWARFGHFILDRIFVYALAMLLAFLAGTLSAIFGFAEIWESPYTDLSIDLVTYLIVFPGYYLFFESVMQSSPGKLILGRIVIDEYGGKPGFKQILGRSYGRVI
ncbi:MAG: RDD family protein, partial [Bacteroidia bacterium]|nr:RDD family protein [Bacteroidia bacterium]